MNYLEHHGILGQKWGIRRYQNADGTLTEAGRIRYGGSLQRDERMAMKRDVIAKRKAYKELKKAPNSIDKSKKVAVAKKDVKKALRAYRSKINAGRTRGGRIVDALLVGFGSRQVGDYINAGQSHAEALGRTIVDRYVTAALMSLPSAFITSGETLVIPDMNWVTDYLMSN